MEGTGDGIIQEFIVKKQEVENTNTALAIGVAVSEARDELIEGMVDVDSILEKVGKGAEECASIPQQGAIILSLTNIQQQLRPIRSSASPAFSDKLNKFVVNAVAPVVEAAPPQAP